MVDIDFDLELLYQRYGIEVTDVCAGETALFVSDELFATYEVPYDLDRLESDIDYIIREGLY